MVLQGVEPYMSSESIEKGARWSTHIGKELEEARFGLVILTKENLSSRWLHFEAGAVAKSVDESRLAPLLFGLRPADVLQPLSQFQITTFAKDDMLKLLRSANVASESALMPETRLAALFEKLWPDLKEKIEIILSDLWIGKKRSHAKYRRNSGRSSVAGSRTGYGVISSGPFVGCVSRSIDQKSPQFIFRK
jgi:hypothetical protein